MKFRDEIKMSETEYMVSKNQTTFRNACDWYAIETRLTFIWFYAVPPEPHKKAIVSHSTLSYIIQSTNQKWRGNIWLFQKFVLEEYFHYWI